MECVCPAGCAGDGFQRFLVSPKSLVAREGDDVVLRCVIVNQRGKVQWTKDGFALGQHTRVSFLTRPARLRILIIIGVLHL